jgi:hypothetical protein
MGVRDEDYDKDGMYNPSKTQNRKSDKGVHGLK